MRNTLFLLLLLLSGSLIAQIENGSFETNDGDPSLLGWIDQCGHANSFMDASEQGGDWCLELIFGNTQGCFPAYFYQTLPDVQSGTYLKVGADIRAVTSIPAKLIIGKIDSDGQITELSSDTTSAADWTKVEVAGIIELEQGDIAAVILQAGLTGGPAGLDHLAYFDNVHIAEQNTAIKESILFPVIQFPNPVQDYLPIWTEDDSNAITGITLFSFSGRELLRMQYQYPQSRIEIYLGRFPIGPYFLLLYNKDGYKGYWVLKT